MKKEWKRVCSFGETGTIYANNGERKLVNPGKKDHYYPRYKPGAGSNLKARLKK